MDEIIRIENLFKIYSQGQESEVVALQGVDLTINKGDFVAIMGASGSGKSTFMNILGCLDTPTSGNYYFNKEDVTKMDDEQRSFLRSRSIGFVFQNFNLLRQSNSVENVMLPLLYWQKSKIKSLKDFKKQRKIFATKAEDALKKVGLYERRFHYPYQLSGGQQQRVAIARALINDPNVILADEPTGNLDSKTSIEIMQIFTKLNEEGVTIILVTHEHDIAEYAHSTVEFKDGKIVKS